MAAPDDAPFMHRPRCTWKCLGARIWGTGASSTPAKPRYDAVSVTWRYLNAGAPSGIRTHTGSGLSRLPLPVGLSGPSSGRRRPPSRLADVSENNEAATEAATADDIVLPVREDVPKAPAGDARRVVVAEDETLIRLDIVETLKEAGYDVVGEAPDGETAVRLVGELEPDVVVMDVKMPGMDGLTAAEKIMEDRTCAVVMLTAFSQTELVERARDAGAMAYVVKPFTTADLLPALEIAISRFQEISSLESEIADLNERFETRKRVDRAKGLLMTKMGLTEPEAFRWIQKTSMDRRLTMREVADAVIDQIGRASCRERS